MKPVSRKEYFLTFGAGTAGMGIAKMLYDELIRQGLTPQEAKQHFYLVDKQGLLFEDTPGLTPKQKPAFSANNTFINFLLHILFFNSLKSIVNHFL